MRLLVMSDLHTEFAPIELPDPLPEADVCVIAGDFGVGGVVPALEWLNENLASAMDVVFVAGNHDYYRTAYVEALAEGREIAARMPRVHFLENDAVTLHGVTFVGCTLWTDFALHGSQQMAMFEARRVMNDYKRIKYSKRPFARFVPERTARLHLDSRSFLERTLASAAGRTVVVSHHAPSARSLPSRFTSDPASPAYASDLEALMLRHAPALWVHGHTHDPVDYAVGSTRVLSNPRGYPGENDVTEFRRRMVVDLEAACRTVAGSAGSRDSNRTGLASGCSGVVSR